MKRRISAGLYLVVLSVVAGPVFAQTVVDCTNMRIEQRRVGRAELDREGRACQADRQCLAQAQAKWQERSSRSTPRAPPAGLAEHAQLGEVWDKAVVYIPQAAAKAAARGASKEAAACFAKLFSLDRALESYLGLALMFWRARQDRREQENEDTVTAQR